MTLLLTLSTLSTPSTLHRNKLQPGTQSDRSSAPSAATLSTLVIASLLAHVGVQQNHVRRVSTHRRRLPHRRPCPPRPLPDPTVSTSTTTSPDHYRAIGLACQPRSLFTLIPATRTPPRHTSTQLCLAVPVLCTITTIHSSSTPVHPRSVIDPRERPPTSPSCRRRNTVPPHRHLCTTRAVVVAPAHHHHHHPPLPAHPTIPNKTCPRASRSAPGLSLMPHLTPLALSLTHTA